MIEVKLGRRAQAKLARAVAGEPIVVKPGDDLLLLGLITYKYAGGGSGVYEVTTKGREVAAKYAATARVRPRADGGS